jgi:hypothetical protein
VIVPTSGDVANDEVKDVMKLIKRAENGIPEQFNKVPAAAAGGREESADVEVQELLRYNAFYASTWHDLVFDAADFGGGSPATVMCHVELTTVSICARGRTASTCWRSASGRNPLTPSSGSWQSSRNN